MPMICYICGTHVEKSFSKTILRKYDIAYFKCTHCGFLQTEKPYWLEEAYSSVIASTDIGYAGRNVKLVKKVANILLAHFDAQAKFLDYAGGYGLFTRLMRDNGFDFYWQDDYCQNLFARYFELEALAATQRHFELVTGFELMEHVIDPYHTLDKIFTYSDSFLFSTELQPQTEFLDEWWYLASETGQHISFYTLPSLQVIAQHYGCQVYSNQKNMHLITRKVIEPQPFQKPSRASKWLVFRRKKRTPPALKSLLQQDYQYVKSIIFDTFKTS